MASTVLINKRQDLILQCIKKQSYPSMMNIVDYVQRRWEDTDGIIASDTIEKDIRALKNSGYEIIYNRQEKGYFLEDDGILNNSLERMMEVRVLHEALKMTTGLESIVQMEQQKPRSTELLLSIIPAIQKRRILEFTYEKYWDDDISTRTVEAYGLKEFKNRWYIVGRNTYESKIKTFALDRISDLIVLDKTFSKNKTIDLEHLFRYSFGIMNSEEVPVEAILSFSPEQGRYVKSLPLHHTQKVLVDNIEELRVSLTIWPTYDFIKELVSYGDSMKVFAPDSLRAEMRAWFQSSLERYS